MRKVILFIACSLDGYIARKRGEIDWLFTEGDFGFSKFYESVDTVLLGRKTYDISTSIGETFKEKFVYVFSKNIHHTENTNVMFVAGDINSFMKELMIKDGKDIWLVGGGEMVKIFLENNFINEIFLFVHPVILGEGIQLFPPSLKQTNLTLIDTAKFDNGLLMMHYTTQHI